ncbi:hypothetical protein IRZ71_10810 [Flavobacterium sp. ANB]|uniref:hypothetical protein n=1 Tax=unclassified Flavobacterium TaxID=196869 RepID=UPI0012B8F468|nr:MULTISPECIES: hypothetical protein [unclassified Flavobacterium]MBF4516840.1 hypothetical protein [Flavobacterium sp. ANB]MTD69264.1 hypothetical protein [Flavobacterium sp. LC2016-13]
MKKKIILAVVSIVILAILIFFVFYYSFFIKPITKEEAGINEYVSLLIIENNTKSKLYIILNHNFSNSETQKFQNYTYVKTNNYSSIDTVSLGGINDYSNYENFELSGIREKPQVLPENFSLKILDSSKHILKFWDKVNFEKDFKIKNNQRTLTITNKNNDIVIN